MKRRWRIGLFLMLGVMLGIGSVAEAAVPEYTYTGTSSLSTDDTYWYLYLNSSGNLTFTNAQSIDIFLVGGGGGGYNKSSGTDRRGGGGGGGYTATHTGIYAANGTTYPIVVGAGGAVNCQGGTTSAFGKSVSGGYPGTQHTNTKNGGNGGSGGGAGADYRASSAYSGTAGASDGNSAERLILNQTGSEYKDGGTGQGSTTRAFGTGALYAGGGGGGGQYPSSGGAGGGGAGAGNADGVNAVAGTANTGGGGGGGSGDSTWALGAAGGSGVVIIRGINCKSHTGGTHANGGKCTTCNQVYQTHSQSSTISSYTKTSTQHTPNYACSYSGCTATYAGTAENHSGATHNNGGKCTVCEEVYETHSQSTAIVSYTQTSTQHTPIYACTLNGCDGTYTGTTELHSGGGENDGMCAICGMQYQTHSPSANIVTYKQTETQHTPIYECNVTNCTQLYLGTAENHSGATHENGGKCTVCGYVYQSHSQSTTVVSYTQQETGHIPVYSCTQSGCMSTYTGALQLHDGTIELHVANSSCESCGWGSESTGGTYVLTINYNDTVVTKDVESGRIVTLGIGSRVDATYTVTTGNAVLKMYGTRRQFVMPAENVTITIQDI